MIRIIFFVAIVSALAAAAVWLANDPGSVTLVWRGWRVDTSVGLLLVAIAIITVVLVVLLRIVTWIRGGIGAFMAQRRERRTQRGLTALGNGLAAVLVGQAKAARRYTKEAGNFLSANAAVTLLRQQAAMLNGDDRELNAAAKKLLEHSETEGAALKVLAQKAVADGNTELALTHARRALSKGDPAPWAVRMMLDADIAARRWEEALSDLTLCASRDAFTPTDHQKLRARLHILRGKDQLSQGYGTEAIRSARAAMDENGGAAAVTLYAKAMTVQGKGRKAAGEIEKAWAQNPNPLLLEAYRTLVPGESALECVQRVEQLVRAKPDHPESRLALAAASLAAELWGQARNRLDGLTRADNAGDIRARAARLMAEVENSERGDSVAVAKWLRESLAGDTPATTATMPINAAALLADG